MILQGPLKPLFMCLRNSTWVAWETSILDSLNCNSKIGERQRRKQVKMVEQIKAPNARMHKKKKWASHSKETSDKISMDKIVISYFRSFGYIGY